MEENKRELSLDEMDKVSGGSSSDDYNNQLNEALKKAGPCLYCGNKIRLEDGRHTINSYAAGHWFCKCGGEIFTLNKSGSMRREI